MGKIKDWVIREEEAEAASPPPAGVPGGGGDEMWNAEAMDEIINDAAPESGEHHVKDALERDFERGVEPPKSVPANDVPAASGAAVPCEEEAPCSEPPPDEESPPSLSADQAFPDLSNVTTAKVPHQNLILEGVCTNCAHCGHKLSDAVSMQRGIGPVCSGRGYLEDPVDGDEIQAMIDLSEFPELVEFLTQHYKPLGIRGLVNGLTKVASLNRPRGRDWSDGNHLVHAACCDAVQSLGHKKLADLLRETLVIMEVRESKAVPGAVEVWVKKRDWVKQWSWDIARIPGTYFSRALKAQVVPVHAPGDPAAPKLTGKDRVRDDGASVPETSKAALWALMRRHYGGRVARINGKAVKIPGR